MLSLSKQPGVVTEILGAAETEILGAALSSPQLSQVNL